MPATNVVAAKENYTRQRGKIIGGTEKHTNFLARGKKPVSEKQTHVFILVIFLFSEESLEPSFHSTKCILELRLKPLLLVSGALIFVIIFCHMYIKRVVFYFLCSQEAWADQCTL